MVKRRRLPPKPAPADAAGPVPADPEAAEQRLREIHDGLDPAGQAIIHRLIVARDLGLWRGCANEACRRARACRGPGVECFDQRRGEVKQTMLTTFLHWVDLAEITPEEFDLFWNRQFEAAGFVRAEDDATA